MNENAAGEPNIPTIGVDEVRAHVERNDVFLLDVRRHARGAQIYGAIRYDPRKLREASRLVLPLPKTEGLIVMYDEDGASDALLELAQKILDDGYGTVKLLEGGFHAWEAAGGRTEDVTLEQPVPQVSGHQFER